MNASEIIKKVNEIYSEPIQDKKKELVKNSDSTDSAIALKQYNAILDNITIGAHTKTTINYAGHNWVFRLLTAEEFVTINNEIIKMQSDESNWDEIYKNYLAMTKYLSRALTPSPYKTHNDVNILTEKDLKLLPYDLLKDLYIMYMDFVEMATVKPTDISEDELSTLLQVIKKNSGLLKELERPKLLKIANYLLNFLQLQEMTQKEDGNN